MSLRAPMVGWTITALLLLAVPVEATPLSGQLSMADGLELVGDVAWSGRTNLVDLNGKDGIPAFAIELHAESAEVRVERQTAEGITSILLGDSFRHATVEPETLSNVRLTSVLAHDDFHVTVSAPNAASRATTTSATIQGAPQVYGSVDPHDQWRSTEPAYDYSIAGQDWVVARTAGLHYDATGDLTVAVWSTDLSLSSSEGERDYRAGTWTEPDESGLAGEREVFQVVWFHLSGATLDVTWAGEAVLAGPTPRLDVTGRATMGAATGTIRLDALGLNPDDEQVLVDGAFAMSPAADRKAQAGTGPPAQLITHYDRFNSGIRGDADRVEVAGAPVAIPGGDASIIAAGTAGIGILVLLGAAYRWGPLAVAVLYSRLEEGQLLDNPTRAQIYDIVKANPGISARQVHRLSTASWGTVVHHLGKLRGAGYVATRSHGRAKCYYENHGKWDAFQEQLAVLTGDKTAAVAEAISAVPGRDQNQIITRTGFSQSTVSYHLLKLEKADLISKERTGAAMAYFPTAALCDLRGRLPANAVVSASAVGGTA